ncbi:MAG: YcgN family cysteine cluster protein [Rhodospirillales bacterium]|nr:YcgN family cysteine cluster protein [Rhodospirillales bacterium]
MDARDEQVPQLPTAEPLEPEYWKRRGLAEMSRAEWEALCDGCGKCCLEKIEDGYTGEISYTNVACRLLDVGTCRCTRYAERRRYVPNCEALTAETVLALTWLPSSCAYRLLAEGRDLPSWHHLVSGDPELVHRVGASVRGRAVPESRAGPLEHHIVTWSA